jgi:hypothetical protein
MTPKGKYAYFLVLFCLLFSLKAFSQLNIKIGYSASYINSDINNKIFDSYNEARPWLESNFENLHFLHGIQLGFRYKINVAAIEFTWENVTRSRNALGEDPSNGVFFEKELFYGMNTFSLGLQNNFGTFGYGATIDSRIVKVKTNIGTSDQKREIVNESGISSKFYISLNFQSGDFVAMSLQPYIQVPWKDINLFGIENELIENTMNTRDQFDENLMTFGITIVFYNGQQ